ncbi:MAG: hypothetical protein R3E53_18705 [Myxococcota bacterium]
MRDEPMLPEAFSDLEPFAASRCLSDANGALRAETPASSMTALQAFYDAVGARADAILRHLATRDPQAMDDADRNLLWLMGSFSTVGFAVDVFKQPEVPDTGGASMPWTTTPWP